DALSFPVDHAIATASGDAQVCLAGFAGAINGTTHHRQTDGSFDVFGGLLNLSSDLEKVNFQPPTSGASYYYGPTAAQFQGLQHLEANTYFFHGVRGKRH